MYPDSWAKFQPLELSGAAIYTSLVQRTFAEILAVHTNNLIIYTRIHYLSKSRRNK